MINRIKTWWREWQARRDARFVEAMREYQEEIGVPVMSPPVFTRLIYDPSNPVGDRTSVSIRIWDGARPPADPAVDASVRQTAMQVLTQRSLEASINRISQSFQHVGEQSEAMARVIAQMQLARRFPREAGTLRDLSERSVEISPKTGQPTHGRHPDTGKTLKSRKVKRSVLGQDVENVRGALGGVVQKHPQTAENEPIAIKFKRRQK